MIRTKQFLLYRLIVIDTDRYHMVYDKNQTVPPVPSYSYTLLDIIWCMIRTKRFLLYRLIVIDTDRYHMVYDKNQTVPPVPSYSYRYC